MIDEDGAAAGIEQDDGTAEQVQAREPRVGMSAPIKRITALDAWWIRRYRTLSSSRRSAATLLSERVMSSFRRPTRSRYFW